MVKTFSYPLYLPNEWKFMSKGQKKSQLMLKDTFTICKKKITVGPVNALLRFR